MRTAALYWAKHGVTHVPCTALRISLVSVASRLLGLRVRLPRGGIDVCCVCVLSGRGLCDELITRPEVSYWLWFVCDLETSWVRGMKHQKVLTLDPGGHEWSATRPVRFHPSDVVVLVAMTTTNRATRVPAATLHVSGHFVLVSMRQKLLVWVKLLLPPCQHFMQ